MRARLPETIDPWQLANTSGHLSGQIPLSEMPRFGSLLLNKDGLIEYTVTGGIDEEGTRFLNGCLKTSVQLQCQRCLQFLLLPLSVEFNLGVVLSESQIERLPQQYDPLLVTEESTLSDMFEDELVLALPIVPKHLPGENCQPQIQKPQMTDAETGVNPNNPFAVLSTLLKDE